MLKKYIDYIYMNKQYINKCLKNNYVPPCLDYVMQEENLIRIDPSKISYNDYFHTYNFFENKFPDGYHVIPGFDKVIESMAINAKNNNISPLKELEERKIISLDNIIDNLKISSD